MSNNLEINIKKSLGGNNFINYPVTLFCKSQISPWGINDFHWEGKYENEIIAVKVPRGNSEHSAKIQKPNSLNIDDQVIKEIKRVIGKLN